MIGRKHYTIDKDFTNFYHIPPLKKNQNMLKNELYNHTYLNLRNMIIENENFRFCAKILIQFLKW